MTKITMLVMFECNGSDNDQILILYLPAVSPDLVAYMSLSGIYVYLHTCVINFMYLNYLETNIFRVKI